MATIEYNLMDGNYWVRDSEGIALGIAPTKAEAIAEAEFWGLDCRNIKEIEY